MAAGVIEWHACYQEGCRRGQVPAHPECQGIGCQRCKRNRCAPKSRWCTIIDSQAVGETPANSESSDSHPAQLAMPAVFNNSDIAFAYPENWQIEEADGDTWCPNVTVASPRTAFWSLSAYPANTDRQQLLAETVEAMRSEYPEIDVEPVKEPVDQSFS